MRSKVAVTKIASSIAPDQYTAAANGAGVDLNGFDGNVIEIVTGAWGGTTPTATAQIQESADNATWTAVADSNLDGITGNAASFALAATSIVEIGYLNTKRYVRVAITAVGGTTPVIRAAANVLRLFPKTAP